MPNLPEFHFRGSGKIPKPHHKTRYVYPSLLGRPQRSLILQCPSKAPERRRPQGGTEMDDTFLTVTSAGRPPPTRDEFTKYITGGRLKDHDTANPLGKAMRRVSAYAGNTVLEMGKFKVGRNNYVVVVKRTTMIELWGHNQFAKEEDEYTIPYARWKDLKIPSVDGFSDHDTWWRRLNDLMTGVSDRAYFCVKNRLEELGMAQQPIPWASRPDIDTADVVVLHDLADLPPDTDDSCPICATDYGGAQGGDPPVKLVCNHTLCLACVEGQIDAPLAQKNSAFTCPLCRTPIKIHVPRDEIILPNEIPYQRWKYMAEQLGQLDSNWQTYIGQSVADEYIPDIAEHETFHDARCKVHAEDTIVWMKEVVEFVYGMLPYGYSLDNPTRLRESEVLHVAMEQELWHLEEERRHFTLRQLTEHLTSVAANAVIPMVSGTTPDQTLGNPDYPPGYENYREFLVKRTAQGAFLSYNARLDICRQVNHAMRHRGIWWKNN